ncbi:hypothetical protein AOLI_G00011570 [Acnodon oligacanthus]
MLRSGLITVEGWPETPVDVFRSEARVELDFLFFKCCLSDGDSFVGLPGLTWLLEVSFSLYLLLFFNSSFGNPCSLTYFLLTPFLMQVVYLQSNLLRMI